MRYVIGALTGSYFTSYTLSATAATTSVLALRPGVAVTDHVPTVRSRSLYVALSLSLDLCPPFPICSCSYSPNARPLSHSSIATITPHHYP